MLAGIAAMIFGGALLAESETLIPIWPALIFAAGIITTAIGGKGVRRECSR